MRLPSIVLRTLGWIALAAAVIPVAITGAQRPRGVRVCIGADRVLRYQTGVECPGGQSRQLVDVVDDVMTPNQEKDAERQIAELQKTVKALNEKVSTLERGATSSRVFAPFEVLDKSGHAILRVSDEAVAVGLKSDARVLLTHGTSGNFILQFRSAYGIYAASIGESATGIGVMHLHDSGGNVRIRSDAKDGYLLFNPASLPIGRLSFGPKGGGYLQLAEPGGRPMVEAGAFEDGVGRVIAGPLFKCEGNPAALGLGLPDCIKGRLK